jgi:hypothetical protein
VLQKALRGRLTFKPEQRGKQRGYRFTGQGSVMPLLTGMIPELSQAVASPRGVAYFHAGRRVSAQGGVTRDLAAS